MSSCGNPSVEAEALMSRRLKFDKSRSCVKCKTNLGNIVIRHAVYCRDCFTPLQTTKFKRSLEPSINPASASTSGTRRTKLKATGNLLIGFSGGLGSTVLLDLVSRCYISSNESVENAGGDCSKLRGGTRHPRNQSVWKETRACYVEMCGAFPESGMRDRTHEVRKAVERYDGFEFISLRIEDAFDLRWWARVGGRDQIRERDLGVDLSHEELLLSSIQHSNDSSSSAALQQYLSSLPTTTAIQSTLTTLTRLLLLYTALTTSSSHLLLGTTLTGLSIGLISGIAMGGGFVVREEAGEEWEPQINGMTGEKRRIKVVRPLRDMGMKECAAWVWWNGLEVVGKESVAGGKQDIGGLTKDFIVGLERDYPSTVSTIARTCAKLSPKDAAIERCVMCERPAQKDVQDWKARISIRSFTSPESEMSIPLPPHIKSATPSLSHPRHSSSSPSLTPYLCYACHTTLTSRSSRGTALQLKHSSKSPRDVIAPLPVWVSSRPLDSVANPGDEMRDDLGGEAEDAWQSKKKMDMKEMRDVVKDFLLEE